MSVILTATTWKTKALYAHKHWSNWSGGGVGGGVGGSVCETKNKIAYSKVSPRVQNWLKSHVIILIQVYA